MASLAFKPNNLQLMRRTTLSDTAFEKADNFRSNECIHTRFAFEIASSWAANQKLSGFCVFRFQKDFDERERFVLSSLYRNIAFIWSVNCAQNILVPPEPPSSSHLTWAGAQSGHRGWLCIPLGVLWRPYGFSYPVLGDMGPAETQTPLQVVDILDLHGKPASSALRRRRSPCDLSRALQRSSFRLEVSQAGVAQVVQAVRSLIARQPAGTSGAFVDPVWCDRS